jgi:sulfur carrier protein ThiS
MGAKIIYRKKEFKVESGVTIELTLKTLEIVPESVIPTRNGHLVSGDDVLEDGDVIRLVPVISGG